MTKRRLNLLTVLAVSSTLIGLAALGLVVEQYITKAAIVQRAAYNTCQLLRGIVLTATPRADTARAVAFIQSTPLSDCSTYAHGVSQ